MSAMKPRRWFVPVGLALLLGLAVPGVVASTADAAECPSVTWGSSPKTVLDDTAPPLGDVTNVRADRHPCYDRMVIDLNGTTAGYSVSYVTNVYTPGQGSLVPLRGGAKLSVVAYAPAYDDNGRATYRPANRNELVNVSSFTTFRQIAYAGSFEGSTDFGLGVRARLPFRVFILNDANSTRIVLDVAHTW
jgi:hypothetical protein